MRFRLVLIKQNRESSAYSHKIECRTRIRSSV